jgi:serine/threonine-protein kinase
MITPDDPTATALAGAVVGQFRLVREVGRGGMGVVYLAEDEQLHRMVAIKTLPPNLAADAQVRARFLREARTAAALSHPNIVPIYSAAERGGVVFFTMGYVQGESLAERIARRGRLTASELVPIVRQLANALGYAHEQGVVHRDVKAENVLIDAHGRALVTDFGIARVAEAQPLTATGTVLGTVHYMSPEQVSGDAVDGRSDLYALGVLMFYALTGRFPFERAAASAVLVAHVNAAPPRVRDVMPDVPAPIDDVVHALLAKSPDARIATARNLLTALAFMSVTADVDATLANDAVVVPAPSAPFTATEAQQLWSRAAQLEANTGALVPPAEFTRRSDAPVTSGYDAVQVRAAALDAGIDDKYVQRAMAEREAAQRAARAVVPADDAGAANITVRAGESLTRVNALIGAPIKLEYEAEFEGELDSDDFEDVADEVRRALGEMITVSAVGRTLTATTGMPSSRRGAMPRYVQVHVSSRNGRTRVRAFEDLSQMAGGLFAGIGVGGGVGVGMLFAGILAQVTHMPLLMIPAALGTMSVGGGVARLLFMRSSRKKQQELEALVRRVVARALLSARTP